MLSISAHLRGESYNLRSKSAHVLAVSRYVHQLTCGCLVGLHTWLVNVMRTVIFTFDACFCFGAPRGMPSNFTHKVWSAEKHIANLQAENNLGHRVTESPWQIPQSQVPRIKCWWIAGAFMAGPRWFPCMLPLQRQPVFRDRLLHAYIHRWTHTWIDR